MIADNLSAHNTQQIAGFMERHPKVLSALHSNVLLLAQIAPTMVLQDREQRQCRWRVHLIDRSAKETHETHPSLQ